jgi:putative tryptophan/tyrosine transport system substrate-binding protein
MKRRTFITLLGGTAATWPLVAHAQQPAIPVIGYLALTDREAQAATLAGFRKGLGETGYVEGRNVAIEYRFAYGQNERFPALAADLVGRKVNAIVAMGGTPAALAAKAATTAIPIVFAMGNDPIQDGLVASLARPGGNITGLTTLNVEVGQKKLELLHELIPAASIIALLVNPTNPNAEALARDAQAAARSLGLKLHVVHASTESDLDATFASLVQMRAGGLVIGGDPFLGSRAERLAALALRNSVPALYVAREFVAAGGLMSYGSSFADVFPQVGVYPGRILKGEKPADLPVQQATKIELIINLKTAKALGLTVPPSLLARADEVIE